MFHDVFRNFIMHSLCIYVKVVNILLLLTDNFNQANTLQLHTFGAIGHGHAMVLQSSEYSIINLMGSHLYEVS